MARADFVLKTPQIFAGEIEPTLIGVLQMRQGTT
jgi:hypothetical protein